MAESYEHIFLLGYVNSEKYKSSASMGAELRIPIRDRESQSQKLLRQFDDIWQTKAQLQQQREAEQIVTREGTYISFTSAADHDLITKSLEDLSKGIRILNIKEIPLEENHTQIRATIYVPNGKEGHFLNKIYSYQTKNNTTVIFSNDIDHETVTTAFNSLGNNISLTRVKNISNRTRAYVNLPVEQEDYFRSEIERLFPEAEIRITPSNADLVNSIEDVSIALLEGLWTDNQQLIPAGIAKWCEVWLNVNTKEHLEQEQISEFLGTLSRIGIEVKNNSIFFPERAVLLIKANRQQIIELMLQSDLLAEFRAGQEPAGFWMNESSREQQNWVEDLLHIIELVDSNVKVCLLDSGVNNGHQLLRPLIDDTNTLTVDNAWGTNDTSPLSGGHGTLMAGIAGYGKLEDALMTSSIVSLTHKLCSVKILPRPNQEENEEQHWGAITNQAISRAEIQNNNHTLIYCLSVTALKGVNKGRPSSWSGEIDNLAYGEGENQRLIIISAGNINDEESWRNYPDSNFALSVQNPAQSWNSLVAGAFTEKTQVNDDRYREYTPIASKGQLSPYSSTSLLWEKKWPIKPDVVFEGGNLLKATDDSVTPHEDLELLSTSKFFNIIKPFETINATSAAAAQAAWFAAKIAYVYPDAWPETIRGLMVHSAKWNPAMLNQMNVQQSNRAFYRDLLRVFGYGVPQIDRALYNQESAFTFIAQETIQPFNYKLGSRSEAETNEIHFFNLPWPKDLLLSMERIRVRLRITLSYFIEPGAGEIGWKDKYRYQSHGLRFDINNIGESEEFFRKRINIAAREENEQIDTSSGSNRWVIGKDNRNNGSIHSDYIQLTAAELATCNHIAVYPIIGWWRERRHLGKVETRTRYSLIISLETPEQDVPLYTTVKTMVEVPIEISTN